MSRGSEWGRRREKEVWDRLGRRDDGDRYGHGDWSQKGDESDGEPDVELDIVCGKVPVVGLYKGSEFHSHVSWMLQTAAGVLGKADALYEDCNDRDVLNACRTLGMKDDEVCVARMKHPDLKHVRAVGTSGKRSVLLALVVALALSDKPLTALWNELRSFKLDQAFVDLLNGTRSAMPPARPAPNEPESDPEEEPDGVELDVISGPTPVVGLDRSSVFHEHASWLLQTATGTTGKSDSLFEYISSKGVLEECRKLGFGPHEVGIVRLKPPDLQHVIAVGTCGKRSIMLAGFIALILQGEARSDAILREVKEYDSSLEKALVRFFRKIQVERWGKTSGKEGSGHPYSQERVSNSNDWKNASWSGKRKWEGEDSSWQDSSWQDDYSSTGWKKERRVVAKDDAYDERSLNRQLDDYFRDGR